MSQWTIVRTFTAQIVEAAPTDVADVRFIAVPGEGGTDCWLLTYLQAFLETLSFNSDQTDVTLGVYRLAGAKIDRLGGITLTIAQLTAPPPEYLAVHGDKIAVIVEAFTGGTVPSFTGVLRCSHIRPQGEGDITIPVPHSGGGTGDASAANQTAEIAKLTSIDGKLPAVAAGADAVANPSLSKLFGLLSGFNGTTWDRIRTGAFTLGTTVTGVLQSLALGVYNAAPTTRTEGQYGPHQTSAKGSLMTLDEGGGIAAILARLNAGQATRATSLGVVLPLDTVTGTITAADISAGLHVTPTAGSAVVCAAPSAGAILMQGYGTYAGITGAVAEGTNAGTAASPDWTNPIALQFVPLASVGAVATISPADSTTFQYYLPTAGLIAVRVRAPAYTSGTLNIKMAATALAPHFTPAQVLPLPTGASTETTLALLGYGAPSNASQYPAAATAKTLTEIATVKATGGSLFSVDGRLSTSAAASYWLQLHDAASATALSNATLYKTLGRLPADGATYGYQLGKLAFTNGIKIAISTTEDTYTSPSAAKVDIGATYQ